MIYSPNYEFRSVFATTSFQKNYLPHAEGSCLVSMGQTRVLCVATVEGKVPPHAEQQGIGWVTAEYSMLPRSGETRSPRKKLATGGRTQEISRLIGRSLRSVVDLSLLTPFTITIDCDVIRADGGTRTAAINGGCVALVQALRAMMKKGQITRSPLRELVGAVSVGLVKGKPVLDMRYLEDKDADSDVNIVVTEKGKFVEIQGTSEKTPFSEAELTAMIRLAKKGIRRIISAQKKTIGRR